MVTPQPNGGVPDWVNDATATFLVDALKAQGYAIAPLEAAAVAELMALLKTPEAEQRWGAMVELQLLNDYSGSVVDQYRDVVAQGDTATELLAAVRARLEAQHG